MKIHVTDSTNFVPMLDAEETTHDNTRARTCIAASSVFACIGLGSCIATAGLIALHYEDIHIELLGATAITLVVALALRCFAPAENTESVRNSLPLMDV